MENSLTPEQLRALRESRKLTLRQVSRATGVSHGSINHLEMGRRRLRGEKLNRLLEFYGAPQLKQPVYALPTTPLPLVREVVMYLRAVKDKLPAEHVARHQQSLELELRRVVAGMSEGEQEQLRAWL
jgi:transcriptional regulator with XRE-family HTH domain